MNEPDSTLCKNGFFGMIKIFVYDLTWMPISSKKYTKSIPYICKTKLNAYSRLFYEYEKKKISHCYT